eukprot:3941574-Rhodomonas_salina.5
MVPSACGNAQYPGTYLTCGGSGRSVCDTVCGDGSLAGTTNRHTDTHTDTHTHTRTHTTFHAFIHEKMKPPRPVLCCAIALCCLVPTWGMLRRIRCAISVDFPLRKHFTTSGTDMGITCC